MYFQELLNQIDQKPSIPAPFFELPFLENVEVAESWSYSGSKSSNNIV